MKRLLRALLTTTGLATLAYFAYSISQMWKQASAVVGQQQPTTVPPSFHTTPSAVATTATPATITRHTQYAPKVANAATFTRQGKHGSHPNPWKGKSIGNDGSFFTQLREQRMEKLLNVLRQHAMQNNTLVLPTYQTMSELAGIPYGTAVQLVALLRERKLVERHNRKGNSKKWRLTLAAVDDYTARKVAANSSSSVH